MNKIFESYLRIWYAPILVIIGLGLVGILTIQYPNEIALYLSLGLPVLAILASVVIGLLRLLRREYKKGLLQIGLTTIVAAIGIFFASFYLMFYPYDFYASNLRIPENISIKEPKGEKFREVVIHSSKGKSEDLDKPPNQTDFELRNSFQPGLYEVDVWIGRTDSGKIYLRAYEITKNDPLSEPYLQKKSAIEVFNPSDSLRKFSSSRHFTIYEGDWDQPYAARFELWYKSDNSSQEVLLTEKNYKIEGWMR